jgi:YaiO family outer membrane protein
MKRLHARLAVLPTLLALLVAANAAAQEQFPTDRVGLTLGHSRLDQGQPDWSERTLNYAHQWEKRRLAEASITETRRFGETDTELAAGYTHPLSQALTASVQLQYSPTHRVLARHGVGASVQYEFRPAWLLHGALRHTRYDDTPVNRASVMLERYVGDWGFLGGVHLAHALGTDTQAYELRASYYYGDRSSIGVIASTGDEATQVGAGAIAIAKVRSLALTGRHALGRSWSLQYGLHRVRQGDYYTRTGATLGLDYLF